jgi:signal transduction histidine kinase/CheY-like chemotaxis protein
MNMAPNTFGLLALIPALLALYIIHKTLSRERSPFFLSYLGLTVACFIYTLAYALELMSLDVTMMYFWIRVEYLGIAFIPYFWLTFSLHCTGHGKWLTPLRSGLLLLIPAFTFIAVHTNAIHHQFYRTMWMDNQGLIPLFGFTRGPLYFVSAMSIMLSLAIGMVLFLIRVRTTNPPYRTQALVGLISSLFPWIGMLIYQFEFIPLHIDTNPLFITFATLGFLIGDTRFRVFDVAPVAHATVFRELQQGIVVMDSNGHIVDANPAALNLMKCDQNRIGSPISMIDNPLTHAICDILDSGESPREVHLPEEGRFIELSAVPLQSRHYKMIGWVVNMQDITTRRRAEDARLDLERRILLADKTESLGLMAGGMAHDYNNLLQVVLGNLDLLDRKLPKSIDLHDYLHDATHATRKAAELTHEMLAFSGRSSMFLREVDLNELIKESIDTLLPDIPDSVQILFEPDTKLPEIRGDASQITHAIINLLKNATEAIDNKQGDVVVATSSGYYTSDDLASGILRPDAGGFVVLSVTDRGSGMSTEVQKLAFDPFFSTKAIGRGLGLPAVLGIARSHHGTVMLDSNPGAGTTMRLYLPVSVKPAEHYPHSIWTPSARAVVDTVVVVDDEAPVREVAGRMLKLLGYNTVLLGGGQEAIDWLSVNAGREVLILLDLLMPAMDGATAFREIRKLNPNQRVILCSGYSEEDATHSFDGQGLSGFVQKPYTTSDLEAGIHHALSK